MALFQVTRYLGDRFLREEEVAILILPRSLFPFACNIGESRAHGEKHFFLFRKKTGREEEIETFMNANERWTNQFS